MFGDILGSLVDKEKIVYDSIQEALTDVSEEYDYNENDFFIMIKPNDDKFNFSCHIIGKNNKWVREITLKEIIG